MKNRDVILSCLFIFSLSSCKQGIEVLTVELSVENSISELSDSSFFSRVHCMFAENDKIYFSDYNRGDIVVLNRDLTLLSTIGNKGGGPGETEASFSFVKSGNQIYLLDDLNRKIVEYVDGRYLKEYRPQCIYSVFKNFAQQDCCLYFPVPNDKHSIAKYSMQNQQIESFGNLFKFDTPVQTKIKNDRFLLVDKHYLYAISDNLPKIERYDLRDQTLLDEYDFSTIPFVKATIEFTKSQATDDHSYYVIVQSVYRIGNKVYLLCNKNEAENDFSCNKIVEFEADSSNKIRVNKIYQLPGLVYSSFCVDSEINKIYAFNHQSSSIESFNIAMQ